MKINTIIFDIGKVLLGYDWDEYFMKLLDGDEDMVQRLETALFDYGMWDEMDRGVMSEEEILNGFISADPEIEDVIRMVYEKLGGVIYEYDFTRPWLRDLKARGYKLYYLSNWSYQLLRQNPQVMSFTELMDGGIYSCHVKMIKPDMNIFKVMTEKYNLDPSNCVFLDDRTENVQAARMCGYQGILVKDHESAAAKLEKMLGDKKEKAVDKTAVVTEQAPAALGPYSQGILKGGTLYVSGQIPVDPATGNMAEDIRLQTEQSMKNVMAIVKEAGMTADNIVKTTVLLTDMNDFDAVNQVYATFFAGNAPARACFQVAALPKGAAIEIEAIAVK